MIFPAKTLFPNKVIFTGPGDEMLTGLEATWGGKWASLGCDQIINDGEMDTSGEEDEYQDYDVL